MFECWALFNGEWIKGWDCGSKGELTAFRPLDNMEDVKYFYAQELSYTKYKPTLVGEWK